MSNREYTNLRKYTNNIKGVFLLFFIVGFLVLPFLSLAVTGVGLDETAGEASLENTDIAVFVGGVIRAVLALLGVIVLIFMVYGGYLWMASGGNEQMVKKSKDILFNTIIGLIIVIAAFAITNFVVKGIHDAASGSSTTSCGSGDNPVGQGESCTGGVCDGFGNCIPQ